MTEKTKNIVLKNCLLTKLYLVNNWWFRVYESISFYVKTNGWGLKYGNYNSCEEMKTVSVHFSGICEYCQKIICQVWKLYQVNWTSFKSHS